MYMLFSKNLEKFMHSFADVFTRIIVFIMVRPYRY